MPTFWLEHGQFGLFDTPPGRIGRAAAANLESRKDDMIKRLIAGAGSLALTLGGSLSQQLRQRR